MINWETKKPGRSRLLFFTFYILICIAVAATQLHAQSVTVSSSSTGNGWGKGGKPKPTPTPTPRPVDGRTDWTGTTNSDFNTGSNWTAVTGSAPPVAGDVTWFTSIPSNKNVNLSISQSIAGFYFNGSGASGYNITSSSTAIKFTLTATGTVIGTEEGDATAVAIGAENTSGTNTISAPIIVAPTSASVSTIYQASGGELIISGVVSGSASITKIGGGTLTFSGANTYTGTTSVNGGTLFVNGDQSAATGVTTVNNTGTVLGGTGTIGGAVTVNSGAVLVGGTGSTNQTLTIANSLTMNSGSIIQLALGPSLAHSTLARTGAGTWSFQSNQSFTFIDLGATTGTYDNIITGLAGDPGTGSWTITNSGFAGTFSYDSFGNVDLILTAVPEPSTWIVGALSLAVLVYGGRRRFIHLIRSS